MMMMDSCLFQKPFCFNFIFSLFHIVGIVGNPSTFILPLERKNIQEAYCELNPRIYFNFHSSFLSISCWKPINVYFAA